MSAARKLRQKLIARRQWNFSRQAQREHGKFFRHLTSEERDAEITACGISRRLETPKQRQRRRERNRVRPPVTRPAPIPSKRTARLLAHLKFWRMIERHRDGEQHVVVRGRLAPEYHIQSKYNGRAA